MLDGGCGILRGSPNRKHGMTDGAKRRQQQIITACSSFRGKPGTHLPNSSSGLWILAFAKAGHPSRILQWTVPCAPITAARPHPIHTGFRLYGKRQRRKPLLYHSVKNNLAENLRLLKNVKPQVFLCECRCALCVGISKAKKPANFKMRAF